MLNPLRLTSLVALVLFATLSFAPAASAQMPSGKIEFKVFKVGFIFGAGGGRGTLYYQGQSYPLNIGGVSLGATIGISSADLVGEVYNLTNVADIQGTYTAVSAGVAIAGGAMTASLKNARGVVLKVRGTQIGLELSIDLGGLSINLE